MKIKEVLSTKNHRPWELPTRQWSYYQEWNKAVFLHWEVDLQELQKLVPEELEIDLYEGKAWVSMVAFTMEKIRPRLLPAFAPISNFDEINIRTYVKNKNKTGVYFLSIEAGNSFSSKLASTLSQLPYRYSKMKRKGSVFQAENKQFNDKMRVNYKVGQEVKEKNGLDNWLTERYSLFQDTGNSINEFEIHHIEWPIYKVDLKELQIDYPRFQELINNTPNKVHYSTGVQVVAWNKQTIITTNHV